MREKVKSAGKVGVNMKTNLGPNRISFQAESELSTIAKCYKDRRDTL